MGLAMTLLIF